MLLQLAAQDIGQLTDIEPRRVFTRSLPRLARPGSPAGSPGGRRFWAGRLVCICRASASLASAWASLGQPMTVSEEAGQAITELAAGPGYHESAYLLTAAGLRPLNPDSSP